MSPENLTDRILRTSERYLKTDTAYLLRGGFWSVVGQISASLFSFVFAIWVAHYLPKDSYGTYKYILSIVSILSILTLSGIGTSVFQSVALGFDGALQEGFWENLRWSILMFIGSFSVAAYYFFFHNDTLAIGILIGGCLTPFLASANLSSSFLIAKKDFRSQTIYFDIIENLIPVCALIVTILLTKNPAIIAAVYFISNTLVTLYIYRRVIAKYRPDRTKKDPHMLSYGKHLSAMGILGGIANNIDQVLLFHFTGPVQLAIYNFAIAIPDQLKGPWKMLNSMLQGRFAVRHSIEIDRGMGNKIGWLFVSSLAFMIVYGFVASYIFKLFFPNYIDAVFYSQLYAIGTLALTFSPANAYLTAKKKIKEQYVLNTATYIFQIGSLLTGILTAGLIGVIIARVATRIFNALLSQILYIFSKRTELA